MAVRATQLVPLSDVAGEGQVIMPDFWGIINDQRVFVTAVLERTVVYIDGPERRLTRRDNCFVDPSEVEVRTSTNPMSWRSRGRGAASVKVVKSTDGEPSGPDEADIIALAAEDVDAPTPDDDEEAG